MALDLEQQHAYETVTLVDRAGLGGFEFIFDGKRFVFKPGKTELHVPRFVAEWLFRGTTQLHVHTTAGAYLCRLGIKDGPDDIVEALGAEALETSPIEIDTTRVEGWDAEAQDPQRASAKALPLRPNRSDFQRDGAPSSATFSGKER